jgi:predicted nucleotidyltransferase
MIRHKRLPADIGRRLVKAAEYLQAHPEVVFAYLFGGLATILKTEEIDLVILNTSPPTLTMNILRHKRLLADKDPSRRHGFESLAFRKYFDFQPFERRLLEKRVQHGG